MGGSDLAGIPLKQLKDRLRELLDLRSKTAKEVSLAAGLSATYVADILSGKSRNPQMTRLQAIAQALNCDLQYLLGQSDNITAEEGRRGIHPMPVLYIAETGAFRPMLATTRTSNIRSINADLNTSYPHAKHIGIDVRDNAMDRAGLADGMTAVCVDFASAKLTVESEKMYAIRRTIDGGKTFETIIRRAMVYSDRTEYKPESSSPDYNTIIVPAGSQMDDQDGQVEPIAYVYGALRIFN
jgi:transcriptional regulator with XRE-family HTH domain